MSPLCMANWKVECNKKTSNLSGQCEIGNRVRIKDQDIEGYIKDINRDGFLVVDKDEMEWCLFRHQFELVDNDVHSLQRLVLSSYTDKPLKGNKEKRKQEGIRNEIVIDLHPEARGSTPWLKLQNQLEAFKAHLDANRGKHGVRLTFINGNGIEDKLRNALVKILEQRKNEFSFRDGNDIKYRFHTALEVKVK